MSSRSLGDVVIAIKAVDEVSGIMGKIQSSMGLLGGQLSQLGGGFAQVGGVIQGFAAGGVAGAAVVATGEIVKGLQDCIKEATSSEAVFASLGAAVTRSGTAWDTVSEATKGALLAMQKTTTYSDEQLAAALERLMTFGLSYDDAMKALGKTIDFAAAKHMDLESAATLVGKAMDGNTAIMKRYGVNIATTKDQAAALTAAQDAAAKAIKAMGDGVAVWVTNVTAAIGADSTFESGLAGAKDKAKYLIDQFKQGNIDLPQFTQAMASLGVPLDEVKMKGGSAEAVLSKLNEQFGGAAQAAASTYAGIQERLKNATQEVGEKIGTIFLPALASLTEGMIPVADALGKGVDSISAWLTEVGKMPEVQGIVAAVGDAFGGFMKYLQDLWVFIVEQFGPVLTELMGAFKELWDALSPIGEAIKEIFSAFGDTGDIDLFKIFITAIVVQIRAVADAIKIAAPYIKQFADAIKAAADFIAPILTQISGGIRGFIDALKTVFQGFYNWLVGGSLWQDLWGAVLSIAQNGITALIGSLGTTFLDPIKNAFTAASDGIHAAWNACWQGLSDVWDELLASAKTVFNSLKTSIDTVLGGIKTAWDACWSAFTSPVTLGAVIDGVKGLFNSIQSSISTALGGIKTIWDNCWNALASPATLGGVIDGIKGLFNGVVSSITTALSGIKGTWDTAWAAIAAPGNVAAAFDAIKAQFTQMNTDAGNALSKLRDDVVGKFGELVPGIQPAFDALIAANKASGDLMKGDWSAAVEDVKTALSKGWEAIQTSAQTIWDAMKTASDTWIDGVKTKIDDTIAEIKTNWDTVWRGFDTISKSVQDTVKTNVDAWIGAVQTKITDTLTTLKTNWDSGWNALTGIFDTVLPAIVKTLVDNLITPVGDKINGLVKTVQDGWTATWTGLAEKFSGLTSAIQGTVSGVFDPLSAYLSEMFTAWAQWASDALTAVEGAITNSAKNLSAWLTSFMGTVYQAWVDFGAAMSSYMGMVINAMIALVQGAAVNVQGILNGMINAAQSAANTIGNILSQIANAIQSMVSQAANAAGAGGNAITDAFSSAWNAVAAGATSFYNWLTGHSLWPDLMDSLVSQTEAGMNEVRASFEKGLAGVVLNAPTIPDLTAAMNITAPQAAAAPPTQAAPAPNPLSSVTLPVTVQIDGATVSRVIERRLIANRQLSAWRQ